MSDNAMCNIGLQYTYIHISLQGLLKEQVLLLVFLAEYTNAFLSLFGSACQEKKSKIDKTHRA